MFTLLLWALAALAGPCPDLFAQVYPARYQRYATAEVDGVTFTHESLNRLRNKYSSMEMPDLVQKIFFDPSGTDNQLRLRQPKLFQWNKDGSSFITLNPPHSPLEEIEASAAAGALPQLKDKPKGLAFVWWYMNPTYRRFSPLTGGKPTAELSEFLRRSPEADSKPLLTMLDLGAKDLPYLRDLKSRSLSYLKDNFGVNEAKDKIAMYFHFPIDPDTITLHLHVRVNPPTHPYELAKSWDLDQVIAYLDSGKSVQDLILDRQKRQGFSLVSFGSVPLLREVPGLTVRKVPNPFK